MPAIYSLIFFFQLFLSVVYKGSHVCNTDKMFLKNYSSKSNEKIDPWFITGFTDGEGCFNIHILKSSSNLIGWQVQARFIIEVNIKDIDLIYKIQKFFSGIGSVSIRKNVANYSIQGIKDITNIVNHFNKYPLQSCKQIDYTLWKNCIKIMLNKKHLTRQGLEQVVSYKNAMNFGQSEKFKLHFPNAAKFDRPLIEVNNELLVQRLNPFWITGFIAAEGSFHITFPKKAKQMRARFSIGLNQRDNGLCPLYY